MFKKLSVFLLLMPLVAIVGAEEEADHSMLRRLDTTVVEAGVSEVPMMVYVGGVPHCQALGGKDTNKVQNAVTNKLQSYTDKVCDDTDPTLPCYEFSKANVYAVNVDSVDGCGVATTSTRKDRDLLYIPSAVIAHCFLGACNRRRRDRRGLTTCNPDNLDQRRLGSSSNSTPRRRMTEEESTTFGRMLESHRELGTKSLAERLYASLIKRDFFSLINCVCVTLETTKVFYPEVTECEAKCPDYSMIIPYDSASDSDVDGTSE